jgi:hypothetical protein
MVSGTSFISKKRTRILKKFHQKTSGKNSSRIQGVKKALDPGSGSAKLI